MQLGDRAKHERLLTQEKPISKRTKRMKDEEVEKEEEKKKTEEVVLARLWGCGCCCLAVMMTLCDQFHRKDQERLANQYAQVAETRIEEE